MSDLRERVGGGDFSERGFTLLVLDRVAIARLNLPGGTTFQWARRLGLEVEEVAKGLLFPGHGYRTGRMERGVGSSTVPVLEGVQVNVRSTARHSLYYILGTRPHGIESSRIITVQSGRRKGQQEPGWMKWLGPSGKRFAQHVNHPGFLGRNFLDEAKEEVLARRGITRG